MWVWELSIVESPTAHNRPCEYSFIKKKLLIKTLKQFGGVLKHVGIFLCQIVTKQSSNERQTILLKLLNCFVLFSKRIQCGCVCFCAYCVNFCWYPPTFHRFQFLRYIVRTQIKSARNVLSVFDCKTFENNFALTIN